MLNIYTVDWVGRHPKVGQHPKYEGREIHHHTRVLTRSQDDAERYVREEYKVHYLRPGEPECTCGVCNVCARLRAERLASEQHRK